MLWISGDTVLYDGVREVADRLDVDTALLHLGGVRFPVTGPAALHDDRARGGRAVRARAPAHARSRSTTRAGRTSGRAREAIERELATRARGRAPPLPLARPRRPGRPRRLSGPPGTARPRRPRPRLPHSGVPAVTATTDTTLAGGRTAWARNLAAPIRSFLHAETGGAVVLVAAAVAALLWANVAPQLLRRRSGTTRLAIVARRPRARHRPARLGQRGADDAVLPRRRARGQARARPRRAARAHAAGDPGRRLARRHGRRRRRVYLAINAGGDGAHGWGAAVSTDTALALGALALLTRGRAIRLRVFLLTLVVIDDLVALLVIALGYTEHVSVDGAGGRDRAVRRARRAALGRAPGAGRPRCCVGVGIWLAMFESGVDAVIAGLAIGLVTSAYPPARDDLERSTELARSFREQPTPELAYSAPREPDRRRSRPTSACSTACTRGRAA